MAKMFYSLDEAAAKLGKSADDVRSMAASGQLEEFRDRDRLMFKREQVDLLAGDDEHIPLADSGALEPIGLASSSGTGISLDNPKEQTGISIFDTDDTEEADPSALTRVTNSPAPMTGFASDSGSSGSGSGSGLLDMTKEVDDTSLGANLLDDVYGADTLAQQTAADAESASGGEEGALFESTPATEPEAAAGGPAMAMVAAEPYDGAGSGLVGGIAIGMAACGLVGAFVLLLGLTSEAGGNITATLGENLWPIVGGLAVLTGICGGLGWFLGRRS